MHWYEEEVRALEQRLQTSPIPPNPAAFYGSSTITLWSTLAADLAMPCALNLGFGGSTLEACAYFFERLVVPIHPAFLVVYAGDNDLGDGAKPESVLKSFRSLAEKVDRSLRGIPFAFISVKPSPARFGNIDRIRRTNDLIRLEIARRENSHFISVFEAMLDEEGNPRAELFLKDGLHLASAGYRLWSALLSSHLNEIFKLQSEACNSSPVRSRQSEEGVPQVVQPPPQP